MCEKINIGHCKMNKDEKSMDEEGKPMEFNKTVSQQCYLDQHLCKLKRIMLIVPPSADVFDKSCVSTVRALNSHIATVNHKNKRKRMPHKIVGKYLLPQA